MGRWAARIRRTSRVLPRRSLATLLVAGSLSLDPAVDAAAVGEDLLPNRDAAPVVLTGAQLPDWSRLPAVGTADPAPSPLVSVRDAHNGMLTVPPDARDGVPVEQIVAHRWDGTALVEIPVQVDQRFP